MSRSVEVFNTEFNGDAGAAFLNGHCANRKRFTVGFIPSSGVTMTKFKTLSAIVVLSAAIASPVFAQDADVTAPARHVRAATHENLRGAYNAVSGAPYDNATQTHEEFIRQQNFGFSGRDPQRVGGEDPDLNPGY